jgi:hypothetical protein
VRDGYRQEHDEHLTPLADVGAEISRDVGVLDPEHVVGVLVTQLMMIYCRGGHVASLEVPDLYLGDVRAFFRRFR